MLARVPQAHVRVSIVPRICSHYCSGLGRANQVLSASEQCNRAWGEEVCSLPGSLQAQPCNPTGPQEPVSSFNYSPSCVQHFLCVSQQVICTYLLGKRPVHALTHAQTLGHSSHLQTLACTQSRHCAHSHTHICHQVSMADPVLGSQFSQAQRNRARGSIFLVRTGMEPQREPPRLHSVSQSLLPTVLHLSDLPFPSPHPYSQVVSAPP